MMDGKPYFKSKYFWAGVFFLIVQVLVVIRNMFSDYVYFFWFCDFVPMILALAFFFKKDHLAKAAVNFGLVFQLGFILLYIHDFVTGGGLSSELIYSPFLNFVYLFTTLLFHLSTTFALLLTYKVRPNLWTINYSILIVVGVSLVSLLFTPYSSNINQIYTQWEFIQFPIPYYIYLWPFLAFIFLILPTNSFQYFLYKHSSGKNRKN